jgi:Rap1a immunity proteins
MTARTVFAVIGIVAAACMGLRFAPARSSEEGSVLTLYHWCKANPKSFEFALCLGFVSGVGDQMRLNALLARDLWSVEDRRRLSRMASCHDTITSRAMVKAFTEWTEKHPDQWNRQSIIGVTMALRDTWPCPL